MLLVHLRVSKCDQFGKGVNIYVGKANGPWCPAVAVVTYRTARGSTAGPFFLNRRGRPMLKAHFILELRKARVAAGLDQSTFAGHSFRIGAVNSSCTGRSTRLNHPDPRKMEQCSLPHIHPHTLPSTGFTDKVLHVTTPLLQPQLAGRTGISDKQIGFNLFVPSCQYAWSFICESSRGLCGMCMCGLW